jgi:hypothetical protein
MTSPDPPAFEPTSIELQSVADSKITSVSVYPTRAEVTRVYKFAVQTGQNQVYISGLPNVLEPESLRCVDTLASLRQNPRRFRFFRRGFCLRETTRIPADRIILMR